MVSCDYLSFVEEPRKHTEKRENRRQPAPHGTAVSGPERLKYHGGSTKIAAARRSKAWHTHTRGRSLMPAVGGPPGSGSPDVYQRIQ
ncbi:hypothetical protein O3P69_017923 [Scylla paramamosain]|uniref:Uncharacterized protein n=1 Tax=Scylla paramamosain TaxID=85552 RepID=A0AAW0TJE8_SCYPA